MPLPVLIRYGYHHDELYFLACGRHFAAGYFDHPPMVSWLARLAHKVFGPLLFGLRLFALISGVLLVMLTTWLAHSLGNGRFAQALAAVSVIAAPVYLRNLRTSKLFCIPAFEVLFWVSACHLLIRIVDEDRPRLWQ